MRARRPLLPLAGLLIAACGSTGPSYSSVIDTASLEAFASDGQAFFLAAVGHAYKGQEPGGPDLFLVEGAHPAADPAAFARGYLARVARLTRRPGTPHDNIVPPAAPGPRLAGGAVCIPTLTGVDSLGDPIDVDADGIPDDYKVDFGNICSEQGSGFVFSYYGSFRIEDTDQGIASFRLTTQNLRTRITYGVTGEYIAEGISGVETGVYTAGRIDHDFAFLFKRTFNTADFDGVATWDISMTSFFQADAGTAILPQGQLPNGNLTLTGEYIFTGQGVGEPNYRVVLGTPATIRLIPACGGPVAGQLQGLVSGRTGIGYRLIWSGCGAPTRQYFGATAEAD